MPYVRINNSSPNEPPKKEKKKSSIFSGLRKQSTNTGDESLRNEIEELKKQLNPSQLDLEIVKTNLEHSRQLLSEVETSLSTKKKELYDITKELEEKQLQVIRLDDEIELAEFGLYSPVYDFANSEQYKNRLELVRLEQKSMIKNDTAVIYPDGITYNNSKAQGAAIIRDNVKQVLRSFNNESEVLIDKVKFSNIESIRKRIISSFESLNKLNKRLNIEITSQYLESKLDELNLAYEYALKKQEEKEIQKEEKERLREEAKLQKEIEEARKTLNKEKKHYENALRTLEQQLAVDPENQALLEKKIELLSQLQEIDKGIADVDYREANKRAGYVYIISNIGSFGEDIYKIGMTRRLEPMDRVNELGDASVPFNFDVHALIFSEDAPKLENALHHAFEKDKLNMVNARREFFHAKLEDIEKVVKENYDKVVEFTRLPEAQQYRESLKMKNI